MRNCRFGRLAASLVAIAFAMLIQSAAARADSVLVAVAANFMNPLKALSQPFEAQTGHKVKISSGSTGQLYAQIRHGAPFDVFLAADEESPLKLETEGDAVAGSRFTYAVGQLVWWHRERYPSETDISNSKPIKTIAIANPKLAPYGRAARQVIDNHPEWYPKDARLVYGQNIAQTYAMISSGNADAGFVARSQVQGESDDLKLQLEIMSPVDPKLHDPIRQDAVLLKRATSNPAAIAFMAFLKTPAARKIIASFGYLGGDG